MFVYRSMTAEVITIARDATVFEAQEKMRRHGIRHLPVVERERLLIGIVTDRDIRSVLPYHLLKDPDSEMERERIAGLRVTDIMTTELLTISPDDTLQDALLRIQQANVGALPVVDDQSNLIGIISVRDLLRTFINVLGIGEPGTLIGILIEKKNGQLKDIVAAITAENISFGSILAVRHWDESKRAVFPYLLTQNIGRIKRKLTRLGYTLIDPMEWNLDQSPEKPELINAF